MGGISEPVDAASGPVFKPCVSQCKHENIGMGLSGQFHSKANVNQTINRQNVDCPMGCGWQSSFLAVSVVTVFVFILFIFINNSIFHHRPIDEQLYCSEFFQSQKELILSLAK